jgi:hypothetical protein
MMPMQIGAVRNATKPSSRAKAFSIENLAADRLVSAESQGTRSSAWERDEAVGCYMLDGKIKSRNSSEVICHF